MVEVGIAEAQSTLATLVGQVERGEEVFIMKDGLAVARLVATKPVRIEISEEQQARAREASEQIREMAKTLPKQPFDWEEIKADLGRKY